MFGCGLHTRCTVHAPGAPGPLTLVTTDGHRETIAVADRPAVCATCSDRPRQPTTTTAAFTWPPPESWDPGRLRYLRNQDLAEHTMRLLPQLPPNVAGICGIPRSGMLPAGILAACLHVPLYTLDPSAGPVPVPGGSREPSLYRSDGPLVIVDDTTWSGQAMTRAKRLLRNQAAIYAAVYVRDPKHVDLYAIHHPGSHVLEWNFWNNGNFVGAGAFREFSGGVAVDFDGVLCEEPLVSDHQDLTAFLRWLSAARPLRLPRKHPVPLVITFRLESWRGLTTQWLDRWGVRVNELVMHSAATVEDRDRAHDVAEHKGQTLRRSRCAMMFESDSRQCRVIHEASGRVVINPNTGEVWQ